MQTRRHSENFSMDALICSAAAFIIVLAHVVLGHSLPPRLQNYTLYGTSAIAFLASLAVWLYYFFQARVIQRRTKTELCT